MDGKMIKPHKVRCGYCGSITVHTGYENWPCPVCNSFCNRNFYKKKKNELQIGSINIYWNRHNTKNWIRPRLFKIEYDLDTHMQWAGIEDLHKIRIYFIFVKLIITFIRRKK